MERAAHISGRQSITKVNAAALELVRDLLERGEREDVFRSGLDAWQVHLLITSLCFYRVSNRYTWLAIFELDLWEKENAELQRQMVVEAVLRYVSAGRRAAAPWPSLRRSWRKQNEFRAFNGRSPATRGIGKSALIGLIGAGIQKSRTPGMHMREGVRQGLRYIYNLIDTDVLGLGQAELPDLLTAAQRLGYNGLNITFPFKQTVIPLLDELSPDAAALGAVNTVVLRDGKRIGHNTDRYGFAEGFRRALPGVAKGRAVQIGIGGAGSAVAHAALTLGIERLDIFDIVPERAAEGAEALYARFGAGRARAIVDLPAAMADADGLIHCTPTGMAKLPGMAVSADLLRPEMWVAEIVYFPLVTELVRTARALGCKVADGGGMAVFQAVEAFRLFTGITPDAGRMAVHFAEWDIP